ncbi:FYDLN acid domain-containing protein [Rhodospirillales bacterium]|nr:FYDLN acid domain-containing protein [Rhodospirillales bacterium]
MAKPDWGKKLTCPSCGARFYNLNKEPATCPKCEATVEIQPVLKPRRTPAEAPKPKKVVKKVSDDDDDVDALLDDDDDDDLIEDTSDLDDDDDDVAEVKEYIEVEKDDN